MNNVTCPMCRRVVTLDGLGAVNLHGDPVMSWHYQGDGRSECYGSHRSVVEVKRNLEEELE